MQSDARIGNTLHAGCVRLHVYVIQKDLHSVVSISTGFPAIQQRIWLVISESVSKSRMPVEYY